MVTHRQFINSHRGICILSEDELVVLSDRPQDSGDMLKSHACMEGATWNFSYFYNAPIELLP